MNATIPPVQFSEIGLNVEMFHVSDKRSWRGPCPACGGHRRYVVFTDHDFPLWHGFCDQCGRKDKFWTGRVKLDAAAMDRLHAQMERERIEYERVRQARLNDFSVSEISRNLAARLNPTHREWWVKQGISNGWQDYYGLGFKPEHRTEHGGEFMNFPAYSIPKFDFGWKLVNIDYRLVGAPPEWGKYRPQVGLPPAPFLSNPDISDYPDEVYIVEGSKKAMVCSIYCSVPDEQLFFVGVPSCNSWAGVTEKLGDRKVWILLDPGAELWSARLCRKLGKNARIIRLPDKPDDLCMVGELNAGSLEQLKKSARGVL